MFYNTLLKINFKSIGHAFSLYPFTKKMQIIQSKGSIYKCWGMYTFLLKECTF
jgi:hypothetical protein